MLELGLFDRMCRSLIIEFVNWKLIHQNWLTLFGWIETFTISVNLHHEDSFLSLCLQILVREPHEVQFVLPAITFLQLAQVLNERLLREKLHRLLLDLLNKLISWPVGGKNYPRYFLSLCDNDNLFINLDQLKNVAEKDGRNCFFRLNSTHQSLWRLKFIWFDGASIIITVDRFRRVPWCSLVFVIGQ